MRFCVLRGGLVIGVASASLMMMPASVMAVGNSVKDPVVRDGQPLSRVETPVEAGAASRDESGDVATEELSVGWAKRVGGDVEAEVVFTNGMHRVGDCLIDTPLPVGYAPPTPPGAIDVKFYPSIRRAEVRSNLDPDGGGSAVFYPLFNHIQRRDIAMTSPVEFEYHGWDGGLADDRPRGFTMSFLYRVPENGETGRDGPVRVLDTEPMTVVAIGVRGRWGVETTREQVATLRTWLASQTEWEEAGEVRLLGYNGPSVRRDRQWTEVQIPVRRVVTEVAGVSGAPERDEEVVKPVEGSGEPVSK